MKKIYNKLGLILLLAVAAVKLYGQDPQFSQFYNNFMYYNPATTGMSKDLRVTTSYRSLWRNIPGDLSTYFISADYQFPNKNIGLGFLMLSDNEGEHNLRTQRIELFYSYRIQSRNKQLQFGTSVFSFNIRDFNDNDFIFRDQLDPVYGVVNESSFINENGDTKIKYPDWNVGVVGRINLPKDGQKSLTLTGGYSASHIFTPNISLLNNKAELPVKHVVHFHILKGIMLRKSDPFKRKIALLNPGMIIEKQGYTSSGKFKFNTFTVGSGFDVYPLRFGIWFRKLNPINVSENYNSVIILAGVVIPHVGIYNHNIMLDYTYDSTVSNLEFSAGGAHEISLIYNFSLPDNQCEKPVFYEWWRLARGIQYNGR